MENRNLHFYMAIKTIVLKTFFDYVILLCFYKNQQNFNLLKKNRALRSVKQRKNNFNIFFQSWPKLTLSTLRSWLRRRGSLPP